MMATNHVAKLVYSTLIVNNYLFRYTLTGLFHYHQHRYFNDFNLNHFLLGSPLLLFLTGPLVSMVDKYSTESPMIVICYHGQDLMFG